ncbi:hypothetical protein I4U23_004211 [Adineta vaga]|nr:hypothetical protein I4U23_004211 [Adineta vaga]
MNTCSFLICGLLLAIFCLSESYARNIDAWDQELIDKADTINRRAYKEMMELAAREVDDAGDDDNQNDLERRQNIPSGSFKGACFFDDHFGKCPEACRKDGRSRGGKCRNFKCLCF